MTFKPSAAQQAYYDWIQTGAGNAVLEAVAGAGKTTTLLTGLQHMNGYVWFGVYNKKMADEIKGKIATRPELAGRKGLFASTFHSAGFNALRYAYKDTHKLNVDGDKVKKIIKGMLHEDGALDIAPITGALPAIVSMAKNRGFGALSSMTDPDAWVQMIEHFDLDRALPDNVSALDAARQAVRVLRRSNADLGVIDFDDMVYLPLQRGLRMLQNDWVLIDEAQDTNPTRRAMATRLLRPGGRLVAVGDPHQAIFGFTGADNDSLEQITESFSCARLPLSVTYRCPKAVVRVAQTFVSHIEAHDSAPEGEHTTIDADMFKEMIQHPDQRTLDASTAILCRYNRPLVELCFWLIRSGVAARIEGREIGEGLVKLATRWKVKKVETLEDRLASYLKREVEKAMKADKPARAERVNDEVETLRALIAGAKAPAPNESALTIDELVESIRSVFKDNVSDAEMLTLCSVHKSKGLEWENVIIYGRNVFMPSPFARQPWQIAQEENLIYVALTRAERTLIDVDLESA